MHGRGRTDEGDGVRRVYGVELESVQVEANKEELVGKAEDEQGSLGSA